MSLRVTDVRDGTPAMIGELVLIDPDASGGGDAVLYDSMMYGYGAAQLLLDGDTVLVLMSMPGAYMDHTTSACPVPAGAARRGRR